MVFSKKEHKLIPDSFRSSQSPGHFAVGVYEVKTSHVIVGGGGVYGCSESGDRQSLTIIQDLRDRIQELSHVFHTHTVLLAGAFNAALTLADANNQVINKPNTVQALPALIEDHQLIDLGANVGCLTHTWHRRDSSGQSSHIDLILTNIPMQRRQYKLTQTIFDHAFVHGIINLDRRQITHAMKDFVLGSEEFLIRYQEWTEDFFRNRGREEVREDGLGGGSGDAMGTNMDDLYCFDDPLSGQTTMHAFSDLVHDLSALHNEIAKSKAGRMSKTLRETSASLFRLQQKLKGEDCRIKRQEMQEEILRQQQTLKTDLEAKDTASRMRISNFYKTGIGKMQPETFYCIKNVNRSRHEGALVTDPDQIVATLQAWYERTAERALPQTETLTDFLARHHTDLPQIEDDQKEALEDEFSVDEVKHAIKEAHEVSASGPSGHTIAFYKLLFLIMPNMMTRALNQLVFLPRLSEDEQLRWVQHRKVIYIPKSPSPSAPSDYRPLSMLEVLYKIPSRILAARLNRILPTIIGPHQHGFMMQKGIQEPSLLATHLIQDTTQYNKPLQLVSFDMEKAFDRVGHAIIIQALRAFGVPEIMVQAIRQYTLVGYAYVEVNGRRGILITIKTGSGQGDPLSSILFLISTEPLNLILCSSFLELMYVAEDNITVGPILYADDNLTALAIQQVDQIHSILQLYGQYTGVSGLNINVSKTTALCLNFSRDIQEGLEQAGLALTNSA
jgi:hypothetical protein